MALPPRTPPRFVPTLTEVVQVPAAPSVSAATATPPAPLQRTVVPAAALATPQRPPVQPPAAWRPQSASVAAPPMASPASHPAYAPLHRPTPPMAVATVPDAAAIPSGSISVPVPELEPQSNASAAVMPGAQRLPDGMEEYMVHRVMQRVDVVLDQRLRDAIATVVQEQTRSVLPRLREEIESVVRHAVYEAVADELASGSATPTRR